MPHGLLQSGDCQIAPQLSRWTTRLAGIICSSLPAWQAVGIPGLARSPGLLGPTLRQPGRMLSSWDHQDFPVPAWPAAGEQESCESGEPQKLNPIPGTAAPRGSSSAAASSRMSPRQGCCCPHSLAPLVRCQSPPGWEAAQIPHVLLGRGLGSAPTC